MRAPTILVSVYIALLASAGPALGSQAPGSDSKGRSMTRAAGTFDVKLTPQEVADRDAGVARMSIDKQFHGDLEGTSKGEMLAAGTAVKDSAGYVAIERVTGTLHGKKGSFTLQHHGVANRGVNSLSVTVVPDSGSDELAGLAGTMHIIILPDGKHTYEFDYTLTR
jgi:uncharacterized protein DUF3224